MKTKLFFITAIMLFNFAFLDAGSNPITFSDQDSLFFSHDPQKDAAKDNDSKIAVILLSNSKEKLINNNNWNSFDSILKNVNIYNLNVLSENNSFLVKAFQPMKQLINKYKASESYTEENETERIIAEKTGMKYVIVPFFYNEVYSDKDDLQPVEENLSDWPQFYQSRMKMDTSVSVKLKIVNAEKDKGALTISQNGQIIDFYDSEDTFSSRRKQIIQENRLRELENRARKAKAEQEERELMDSLDKNSKKGNKTAAIMDIIGLTTSGYNELPMIPDAVPQNRKYTDKYSALNALYLKTFEDAMKDLFLTKYDGKTISGDTENNTGLFVLPNGDKYEGTWKQSSLDGECMITYSSGAVFKGTFSNGFANGKGEFISKDGNIFRGNYTDGVKHGKGQLIIKKNTRYYFDQSGMIYDQDNIQEVINSQQWDKKRTVVEEGYIYNVNCKNGKYVKIFSRSKIIND